MYEEMLADYCERIVHADLSDAASVYEVLAPLHAERPFERILTTSEAGAVPTAQVVERFGLEGNSPEAVRALQDKLLTRRALDRAGVSPVRYEVVEDEASLTAFVDSVAGGPSSSRSTAPPARTCTCSTARSRPSSPGRR